MFSVSEPIFTTLVVYLLNGLAIRIEVLLPQYTSLALGWPLAAVNQLLALKDLVTALMLFALPSIRKIYLEPRFKNSVTAIDLFVTQASLVANMIGIVGLGLSAPVLLFILSLCVYTSGAGLADSLFAYGTHTLPSGEKVADLYVRLGLIGTVAALIGAPLWSVLFSVVLKSEWIPLGLPFLLSAGLFAAGWVGVRSLKSA